MKSARCIAFILIFLCAAPQAILPACGWYWPIMGFQPPAGGCPNICGGPGLPPPYNVNLPGTFQWGYPPMDRAQQVYPGCAYGPDAFRSSLSFGSALPFSLSSPGRYAPKPSMTGVEAGNETAAEANNTSSTGTRGVFGNATAGGGATDQENRTADTGGMLGWLTAKPMIFPR